MANALQNAGALSEQSNFAPLHTNRIFTGLWTNRSRLRDAATNNYEERSGMGRQDSILGGQNSEITPHLTLRRRVGNSVYNTNQTPPVNRFYSFNTFTLATETIRVLADTAEAVYDVTRPNVALLFQKTPGANPRPTYFLGVGNILYFTNGVDNMQWVYDSNQIFDWGINAPANAPIATQAPRPNPYPGWAANTAHACYVDVTPQGAQVKSFFNEVVIVDANNNLQVWGTANGSTVLTGNLGTGEPPWKTNKGELTQDGTIQWTNQGPKGFQSQAGRGIGELCVGKIANPPGTPDQLFVTIKGGNTVFPDPEPIWPIGLGQQVSEGEAIWQNIGPALHWIDVGKTDSTSGVGNAVTTQPNIVDPSGNLQTVYRMGVTGSSPPTLWATELYALTTDNNVIWQNSAAFAVPGTAPIQYGYAFKNSVTGDISNMSPKSNPITVIQGNQVQIQGDGSTQTGADTIILYRTAKGGSTFLYLTEFPNPPTGQKWTYIDNTPDSGLNTQIQAQVGGEGTPLPKGATCLGYHLGRIFAAVGNVVYISSGPNAVASTSSGNSGFDTTFTAQSKITRFWTCSLGMVVFTVRDAYIILGSGTSSDPLYMVIFVEQLPLLHYDAFTVNKTTPMMMLGNNMVVALDPSAGIVEVGFPIADRLEEEFDAAKTFVTFHTQSSKETALYVANGNGYWYRMNSSNTPEQGSAWSTRADIAGMGCVQSVEVEPGIYSLLWSGTAAGPIMQRDTTKWTDNGNPYPVTTLFGNIVMAHPGQLAALSFITLESVRVGTRAGLALLLGEISGQFDELFRTHQDPPNLPPSHSIYSDRYHFEQNQKTAWCRHFQMEISWPPEDAPNELLTFTIFGQNWQEYRSQ